MKPAAVILAGGASTRMGTAKALLKTPGEGGTFLDRLIWVLGTHCSPVIVVLGHQAEMIRAGTVRAAEAVFVVNPAYSLGQLSSLQCGLRAVPPEAPAVLFTPVDIPMVEAGTVEALVADVGRGDALVAIPRFQGRRGHPVACTRELIPEFLALGADAQARDVIHRHRERTRYVDVNDEGILRDIDDPDEYRALAGAAQQR